MAATKMSLDILQGVHRRIEHLQSMTGERGSDPDSRYTAILDVIEGLRSVVFLRDYLTKSLKLALAEVFENRTADCTLAGKMFQMALDVSLQSCDVVQRRVGEVIARKVPDELAAEFEQANNEFKEAVWALENLKRDFPARWPWIDHEKLAASIAAEKQGIRRFPAKEVFDELRHRVR